MFFRYFLVSLAVLLSIPPVKSLPPPQLASSLYQDTSSAPIVFELMILVILISIDYYDTSFAFVFWYLYIRSNESRESTLLGVYELSRAPVIHGNWSGRSRFLISLCFFIINKAYQIRNHWTSVSLTIRFGLKIWSRVPVVNFEHEGKEKQFL